MLKYSQTSISILRRNGMTWAGLREHRRPMMQIASSRISKTSSFRAMNRAARFSAWARWGSNFSSRDMSTQKRTSGSERHHDTTWAKILCMVWVFCTVRHLSDHLRFHKSLGVLWGHFCILRLWRHLLGDRKGHSALYYKSRSSLKDLWAPGLIGSGSVEHRLKVAATAVVSSKIS